MASFSESLSFSFFLVICVLAILGRSSGAGYDDVRFKSSQWSLAHATFYGDESASETMGMSFTSIAFNSFSFNNFSYKV